MRTETTRQDLNRPTKAEETLADIFKDVLVDHDDQSAEKKLKEPYWVRQQRKKFMEQSKR